MKKYDLIVVGGGVAGVGAAVCAAREGLSVLLIEKIGSLGGAMVTGLVYPFMKHAMNQGKKLLSDGIFTEMKERKKKYDDTSWECYKLVFDDMLSEAGADVLFHATVFDAVTEGRNIKSISVASKSGVLEFCADYYIDATGDGELMTMVGCAYQLGRESDGLSQPMTTCFRMAGVDIEAFKKDNERLQKLYCQFREEKKIKNPREDILTFYGIGEGILHLNTTRIVKLNPVDPFDISRAEAEARKQVYEIAEFLKKNCDAFKNSCIIAIANHIGVRESRKLKGSYILTEDDLKNCVSFEDTIALGNYDIDIHNPAGTGTYLYKFKDGQYYQIPYRCLLPVEYDNMLVAGRCLSATHEAHSAVRIMPICACLGQAAGTAVALAKKTGKNVHTLDTGLLRTRLSENGAAL